MGTKFTDLGNQAYSNCVYFFKKKGQSQPLFVYFRYFLITISIIQIEISVDGVLGIRTRGRRMFVLVHINNNGREKLQTNSSEWKASIM